jgi:hypothetical protein
LTEAKDDAMLVRESSSVQGLLPGISAVNLRTPSRQSQVPHAEAGFACLLELSLIFEKLLINRFLYKICFFF